LRATVLGIINTGKTDAAYCFFWLTRYANSCAAIIISSFF